MPRITRLQRLQSLPLTIDSLSTSARPSFLASRGISTTCAAQSKNTEWVRGKLWKGDAPGPADPYTQRPEPEEKSNLPEEALESRPPQDKTPAAVRNTRILLPAKRSEATTEQELKTADPTYVPAMEADGLEEIGTLSTWWDQPNHWGEESEFKGFGSTQRVVEKDIIEVHLRRAVVEVLALQQAGAFPEWATKRWQEGARAELDEALLFTIEVVDGKATLTKDASAVAESLTSDVETDVAREGLTAEEAKGLVKQWDPSWKSIVLNDEVKFALRKRLYQLTGNLIPDSRLAAANTIKHVLALAAKDPKPLKLVEVLEKRNAFQELSNVKLHNRKIGAIDKEVAVGRWKVIEEELKKRDLPVTGYGNLRKNKERDWLSGKV
ncbi:hypothetical protein PT974_03718 [Cladobotryum mycophilum]|uniref:Large ribosomal subunit protein mL50 n=1 Tax=Cladobotryum mycophilum TaxID=491253 RepID=A0ABR0SUA2_9HYPO